MRDQDSLDVTSNFVVWKARLTLLLEENGIKDYVTTIVVVPIDVTQLVTYKKDDAKERRIILHGIKDHIFPHILKLGTMKKMCGAILNLY